MDGARLRRLALQDRRLRPVGRGRGACGRALCHACRLRLALAGAASCSRPRSWSGWPIGGRVSLLGAFRAASSSPRFRTISARSSPDYWQLSMGILFIVVIIFFKDGFAGRSRPAGGSAAEGGDERAARDARSDQALLAASSPTQDIDFRLERGEIRAVIGPNGAGKTTFISMISGHLRPSAAASSTRAGTSPALGGAARPARHRPQVPDAHRVRQPVGLCAMSSWRCCGHRAAARRASRSMRCWRACGWSMRPDTPARFLSHGQRQWLEIGLLSPTRRAAPARRAHGRDDGRGDRRHGPLVPMLARDMQLSVIIIEHDINFIRDLARP